MRRVRVLLGKGGSSPQRESRLHLTILSKGGLAARKGRRRAKTNSAAEICCQIEVAFASDCAESFTIILHARTAPEQSVTPTHFPSPI
jgi:hypothetical protein